MTYLFTNNQEVKNDVGNPLPVSKNTTVNSAANPIYVDAQTTPSGGGNDAFGRQRVSEPFTLGDYKHLYALDPNFVDKTSNGGSVTFLTNKACAQLATTSNTSSYAAHQTKFYHHYQPGKSQTILSSICFGYAQRNVTKRTGYFDDRDGIYFEQVGSNTSDNTNNGTLNFVVRSYVSGSPSEATQGEYIRRVPQHLWNVDKCDGTGASGFNINMSKTQLIYMDFQWLGVGRIRVGFVHDGTYIVAHEYNCSNVLSEVYISNPNLPVRCEILNTGTTTGGSLDQICATVISEGGYSQNGIDWAIAPLARTTASPAATPLPLVAIRLKNTFNGYPNRITARLNNVSFYAETNSVYYQIIKLPTAASLTGTVTWQSVNDDSAVEYSVSQTGYVVADGDMLSAGFIPAGASQNSLSPVNSGELTSAKKNALSQNFDSNNSEVYLIVVKTISTAGNATATVGAALQWREIY